MKTIRNALFAAAVLCGALFLSFIPRLAAFEPLGGRETALLKAKLSPPPQKIEFGSEVVRLDESLDVTLDLPAGTDSVPFEKFFAAWFGKKPVFQTVEEEGKNVPADGYRAEASGKSLRIAASNAAGLLNALKTLRQLAEANRGTATLEYWFVPELKIEDAPAASFRGIHLCWFPETNPWRIEQGIRMAAYYKFNYCVLELWGVYRFEKHPDFCWSEYAVDKKEIRRLVALGRELGITLLPQFNLFGHASAARGSSGKHAILDFAPQYAPLFEPDGWTWCLSNPETRRALTDVVLELYDAFDAPPYFHLGCDEALSAATCRDCRRADYAALLLDHLVYFNNLLKERSCRTMLWHDMLIKPEGDFKGYVANGNDSTAGLLDKLPKEMIICDWQYDKPREKERWPTMRFFKEKGFDVIACPWNNPAGMVSQGALVRDEKLFGILCTTWHHFYGDKMFQMLAVGARAAWGTERAGMTLEHFSTHLRQIGSDAGVKRYIDTGIHAWQVEPLTSGPK